MTRNRTKIEWKFPDPQPGWQYGIGVSQEMIDLQREMNGIHDDRVDAMALAMFVRKPQPWYKRGLVKMKGWWQWLKRLCRMTKKSR
jgi:hypothetical protein